MNVDQIGRMSSEVVEIVTRGGGAFILTLRLAGGKTVQTEGRMNSSADDQTDAHRSFDFDSEEFHDEVMKGNVDIRSVCATLARGMVKQQ